MSGSVIVAGARTPMGRLLGSLKGFSGAQLGGVAIKAALERAGVAPEQVQYVIMGQVLTAGAGQIPARQAAAAAGIPMSVPARDRQQGLPVRAGRDRAGRPAHPGRRVRHRGGRRPGVDDPGAAPARQVARGLQVRRRADARPHGARRPVLRVRPGRDGRLHREVQRPLRADPRRAGRVLRPLAPAGRRGGRRTGVFAEEIAPVADPAAQGRPDRVQHRRGRSAATPPPRAWPGCARRSPRTGRSPPAPPRRSPTAPRRWW